MRESVEAKSKSRERERERVAWEEPGKVSVVGTIEGVKLIFSFDL